MDQETLKYMRNKPTEELKQILNSHNTHVYKEETFDIIKYVLDERENPNEPPVKEAFDKEGNEEPDTTSEIFTKAENEKRRPTMLRKFLAFIISLVVLTIIALIFDSFGVDAYTSVGGLIVLGIALSITWDFVIKR